MKDKKVQPQEQNELLKEYYAQVESGDDEIHTHIDYSDSYGDSCC